MGFGYHAILFSFLMVAAGCDLDGREIPLGLTLTGAVVGLIKRGGYSRGPGRGCRMPVCCNGSVTSLSS